MGDELGLRQDDTPPARRRQSHVAPCSARCAGTGLEDAGDHGAETLRLSLNGFADGMAAPARFNEAWLIVLPQGSESGDATGDVVKDAGALRPLLLKNVDTKIVAVMIARATRPVMATGAHATQRGLVSKRDMSRGA